MNVGSALRSSLVSLGVVVGGAGVAQARTPDRVIRSGDPVTMAPSRQQVLAASASPAVISGTALSQVPLEWFPNGVTRYPATLHFLGDLEKEAIVTRTPGQLTVKVGDTVMTTSPDPADPQHHVLITMDNKTHSGLVTTLPDGTVQTETADGLRFQLHRLPDGRLDAAAHGMTPFGTAHIYFPPVKG